MENVKSNRCKAEQNECESKNTFPYAILRALAGTESVSAWKSSGTHSRWDISVLQTDTHLSEGLQQHWTTLWIRGAEHQGVTGAWCPSHAGISVSGRAPSWLLPHLHDSRAVPLTRFAPLLTTALLFCYSIHEKGQMYGPFGLHSYISQLCHRILTTSH